MEQAKVKFEKGGKARCTGRTCGSLLEVGKEYEIHAVGSQNITITLNGGKWPVHKKWFEPVVSKAPGARWFVIDSTKDTLVAVGLTNRVAGVEWIKSFGNTAHRYIIAKETGEFVCTRTVAEV